MESLLAALEAYRAAGGEGLIFVIDDGLQLLDKIERHALLQPSAMSLVTHMQAYRLSRQATRDITSRFPPHLYASRDADNA